MRAKVEEEENEEAQEEAPKDEAEIQVGARSMGKGGVYCVMARARLDVS
ncbi:hypothetical protein ACP4OV_008064 [Aristida adscensionis]